MIHEGCENLQNRQMHIPRKNCRDGKPVKCSGFPSFFRNILTRKDGKTLFSGFFPSFSGLCSPKKGGGNSQLRGFPILRIFGRDVKMRKYNSFPSSPGRQKENDTTAALQSLPSVGSRRTYLSLFRPGLRLPSEYFLRGIGRPVQAVRRH